MFGKWTEVIKKEYWTAFTTAKCSESRWSYFMTPQQVNNSPPRPHPQRCKTLEVSVMSSAFHVESKTLPAVGINRVFLLWHVFIKILWIILIPIPYFTFLYNSQYMIELQGYKTFPFELDFSEVWSLQTSILDPRRDHTAKQTLTKSICHIWVKKQLSSFYHEVEMNRGKRWGKWSILLYYNESLRLQIFLLRSWDIFFLS